VTNPKTAAEQLGGNIVLETPMIGVRIAVFGLTLASSYTAAQSAGRAVLEEVLVTAQRKTQSIQNVPISISVVSADDMLRNSIFDFRDTAELTPGVNLSQGSAALASINVRGVGPGFFAPTAQAVPIFVDEIPVVHPGAAFSTMVDVERVELLRGPQGTLYGKNAPSGAYNITTVAPSFDKVKGFVNTTYAQWDTTGEPTVDVRGAVNLPITENFAARLAGVYADSNGGSEMESPFASDDTSGGKDHQSARLRLLYEPTETSRFNIISNYQDLEDNYAWRLYDGLVPATGGTNPVDAIYTEFSDRADFSGERSESTTKVKDIALKYLWDGELTNIDFILAYQDFETTLFQNQTPYPTTDPGRVDLALTAKQTSMELRAYDNRESLDYVAGIYLSDSKGDADTDIDIDGAQIPSVVSQKTSGAAIFGNFTFHITEKWDLGVGARYEDNSQDYKSFVDIVGFDGNIDQTLDFNHLSWSLKLSHFVNENATAYLAIDNAYRQGGLNAYSPGMAAVGEVLNNEAIVETAEAFLLYDEEVSTAYEIGMKGSLLENTLGYSVAIFYQQFDDHIIRQNNPSSPELEILGGLYTLVFVNAEEVTTQGIELDLTYVISERWSVEFRSAYFDATVGEWQDRLCEAGFDAPDDGIYCPAESGSELSELPKWNTNTQLIYFRPLDTGWILYSTLSWTWRSKAAIDSIVTNRYNDPQSFVNFNVGMAKDEFFVTVWGKNLTDQQNIQTPFNTENGDPSLPPALTASPNEGMEYGVTLGYYF
jgi:iron complex outermembrane receptor protein